MSRSADRQGCVTQKVQTKFGSHYVHLSFSGGCVTELSFSSPGKFSDTDLGNLLSALADAANDVIRDVGRG